MSSLKAAIDIGTNSIRLLVADVNEGAGRVRVIARDLVTTRLGEGMAKDGQFSLRAVAIDRSVRCFKSFVRKALNMGVDRQNIVAIATSAVREASNARDLLEICEAQTGILPWVVPGEEEARLNFLGAVAGFGASLTQGGRVIVLDVGGGSTELSLGEPPDRLTARISIPIGAVRATQLLESDRKRAMSAISNARARAAELLESTARVGGDADIPSSARDTLGDGRDGLIVTGGTATSLAAIEMQLEEYDPRRVHGYTLSLGTAKKLLKRLEGLSIEERRNPPGLQPERADIIAAGALILVELMEAIGSERAVVSEADIMWGMLLENGRRRVVGRLNGCRTAE